MVTAGDEPRRRWPERAGRLGERLVAAGARWRRRAPRWASRRNLLIATAAFVLLAAGALAALVLRARDRPEGHLDTELKGVSVVRPTVPVEKPPPPPPRNPYRFLPDDRVCWTTFGGNPQRTLSRPQIRLGRPTRHFWVRGLRSYIEYPPSYCDGVLYVNSFAGVTFALDSHSGRVIWRRRLPGRKPSTPAIAGDRLIVSSQAGTVTALRRSDGRSLWQFRVDSIVESSPVVVRGTVYFGATDGRLFALDVRNGRVRWAYDTGGRINASPSVYGRRVCISTYAGSIFCLRRTDGKRLWRRYIRRDAFRYESFYASPSTDGRRIFSLSRAGKVVALAAGNGRVLWTRRLGALGYSTPAVARGRIFVGDFDGELHAFRAATGRRLWRRRVPGRILGPPFVVGGLVFFSTLEERTYAARIADGRIVWRIGMGKYSPGIATDRHYFFTLNGIVIAFHAERPAKYRSKRRKRAPRPRAQNSSQNDASSAGCAGWCERKDAGSRNSSAIGASEDAAIVPPSVPRRHKASF